MQRAIKNNKGESEQVAEFYSLLQGRQNSFSVLKHSLLRLNQTGAYQILEMCQVPTTSFHENDMITSGSSPNQTETEHCGNYGDDNSFVEIDIRGGPGTDNNDQECGPHQTEVAVKTSRTEGSGTLTRNRVLKVAGISILAILVIIGIILIARRR